MAESFPPAPPEPGSAQAANAPRLAERQLQSTEVYRGHLLQVRRDIVELPDGREAGREYIVHPGAVMVVPIADDGRLVVERQYRYPLSRVMLEFPAGKLDAGESTLACGMRELAEETGYRAREWAHAGVLHNAIAYSTEGIAIWFARGLEAGEARLDAGEFLEVELARGEDLLAAVARGEITDAKTMIGLLWWQNLQTGAWSLDWQPAP